MLTKARRKIWSIVVRKAKNHPFYFGLYSSYWHSILFKKNGAKHLNYFSARPNPGAGIGHQMANWIAGYWYARKFELGFAHIPFSSPIWEGFLGFGEKERTISELKKEGYNMVRLPLFDEYNPSELHQIKKIIASYNTTKVVFVAEQDQGYKAQYGVMEDIKKKFHANPFRRNDKLRYSNNTINIAIHIRRGDIAAGRNPSSHLASRWQGNKYFYKVLEKTIQNLPRNKVYSIYLFSQGEKEDFSEFNTFKNINYCTDMGAMDSFLHMVFADILITSKSSFSYKPALLSKGIKICPKAFWHDYPKEKEWVLVDENGNFDDNKLKKLLK